MALNVYEARHKRMPRCVVTASNTAKTEPEPFYKVDEVSESDIRVISGLKST
jgi:hypothetical protein